MNGRRCFAAFAIGLLVAPLAACAGGQTASDPPPAETEVQGRPPKDDPPDELPEGAPIKMSAESAETAEPEGDEASIPPRDRREALPEDAPERSREYVSEAQVERLLRLGPSYVFRAVTVEPVDQEGDFAGYRIVDASSSALEVMAPQLEVGDVVEAVNGVPIERPNDYMKAWKKLEERTVFEVEFRRDGESREAHWVVDERARR